MNAWKAILAAWVIFCAGAVSGALLVKLFQSQPPPPHFPGKPPGMERGPGWDQRTSFLRKLQHQLNLTDDQSKRIESILNESQERIKKLWDQVAPDARDEFRKTQDLIRKELTPEQQVKYEILLREHKPHRGDNPRDPKRRGGRPPEPDLNTNPSTPNPEPEGSAQK